jgi:hypothetical protein
VTSAKRTSDPLAKTSRLPTFVLDAAIGSKVSVGLGPDLRDNGLLVASRHRRPRTPP